MPKKIDPTTINTNIVPDKDSASEVLKTQINRDRDAYNAVQISNYSDIPNKFFDDDLFSNLKDLTGSLPKRPPTIGNISPYFTVSGITDWGALKQGDSDIWDRRTTVESYQNTNQSKIYKNLGSVSYPYNKIFNPNGEGTGGDPITDPIFNVVDDTLMSANALAGAGMGQGHLSVILDSNNDLKSCRTIYYNSMESNNGQQDGFTISGFLFPADRGTVALLHWDADQNNFLTQAVDKATIMNRVIGAINLGQGINSGNDGLTGGDIFVEGNATDYPSRLLGQYDLAEMQRAKYRYDDPSRTNNALPNYIENRHLGAVRLLKDSRATSFADNIHPSGNLPVLFGTEMWDFDSNSYFNYDAVASNPDKNFLSYRLPYLSDYSTSSITTPKIERARYYQAIKPSSATVFTNAGNYDGFDSDAPSYQIARYRYTVTYKQIKAGLEAQHTSMLGQTLPVLNIGSFALIHFKTEDAFERLVRDGVAPSNDDLWSAYMLDYNEGGDENNMVEAVGDYDEKGLLKLDTEEWVNSLSNNIVKPSIVKTAYENKIGSLDFNFRNMYTQGFDLSNNYSSSKFGYNQRYMNISGIYHILPVSQRYYDTSFLNVHLDNTLKHSSFFFSYKIEDTAPPTDINNDNVFWSTPFYAFKDQQGDGVLKEDNYGTTGTILRDEIHTFNYASFAISTKDLSSNDRVNITYNNAVGYINNNQGNGSIRGLIPVDHDALISTPVNTPYALLGKTSSVEFGLQYMTGMGDRKEDNFPTFSDGLEHTIYAYSPMNHELGLPIETVLNDKILGTNKFLYHSAYCKSLIQHSSTDTIDVAIRYSDLATRANHELAFILYRTDGQYIIAQELTLLDGNLEKCTGEVNPSGGDYSDYLPVYRPTQDGYTNANTDNNFQFVGVINVANKLNTNFDSVNITTDTGNNFTSISPYDSYFIEFINEGTLPGGAVMEINIEGNGWVDVTSAQLSGFLPVGFDILDGLSVNTFNQGNDVNFLTYNYQTSNNLSLFAIEVNPNNDGSISEYGNFCQSDSGSVYAFSQGAEINAGTSNLYVPVAPYRQGFTARKDTQERFLDEIYRIRADFLGFTQIAYTYNAVQYSEAFLLSQGHPSGAEYDFQSLTIRDDKLVFASFNPAVFNSFPHKGAGWVRNSYHVEDLSSFAVAELQVAPLPYRTDDASIRSDITVSRGRLIVPNTDYNVASYRPSTTDSISQPDYSSGNTNLYNPPTNDDQYVYTRFFDLRFSRSNTLENSFLYGTTNFKIRLVGLGFDSLNRNFSLTNPTLNQGVQPIAVLAMIAGKTGWLNVARSNETDESLKSGLNSHTATYVPGCRTNFEENVLKKEGVRCLDLTCDMSPYTFYQSSDSEIPVLIRVIIQKNGNWDVNDYGFDSALATENTLSRTGLIGIEVLRNSNGLNYDEDEVISYSEYV